MSVTGYLKHGFSGIVHLIPDGKTIALSYIVDSFSLYEFVYTIINYTEGILTAGDWEVWKNVDEISYVIQFKSTVVSIPESYFNQIKQLATMIQENEELFYTITRNYLNKYGTI